MLIDISIIRPAFDLKQRQLQVIFPYQTERRWSSTDLLEPKSGSCYAQCSLQSLRIFRRSPLFSSNLLALRNDMQTHQLACEIAYQLK